MMNRLLKIFIKIILFASAHYASAQQGSGTAEFKREFLEDINHIRQQGCNCGTTYMPPVQPLVWNEQLAVAANGHAHDMFNRNYFSHTSQDGRSMQQRINAAGYTYNGFRSFMVGENIAMGQQSIAQVMQGWFKSEGHCKNLMSSGFKEIGIAAYKNYWVQDFGGRQAFSSQEQRMIKSGRYHVIEGH